MTRGSAGGAAVTHRHQETGNLCLEQVVDAIKKLQDGNKIEPPRVSSVNVHQLLEKSKSDKLDINADGNQRSYTADLQQHLEILYTALLNMKELQPFNPIVFNVDKRDVTHVVDGQSRIHALLVGALGLLRTRHGFLGIENLAKDISGCIKNLVRGVYRAAAMTHRKPPGENWVAHLREPAPWMYEDEKDGGLGLPNSFKKLPWISEDAAAADQAENRFVRQFFAYKLPTLTYSRWPQSLIAKWNAMQIIFQVRPSDIDLLSHIGCDVVPKAKECFKEVRKLLAESELLAPIVQKCAANSDIFFYTWFSAVCCCAGFADKTCKNATDASVLIQHLLKVGEDGRKRLEECVEAASASRLKQFLSQFPAGVRFPGEGKYLTRHLDGLFCIVVAYLEDVDVLAAWRQVVTICWNHGTDVYRTASTVRMEFGQWKMRLRRGWGVYEEEASAEAAATARNSAGGFWSKREREIAMAYSESQSLHDATNTLAQELYEHLASMNPDVAKMTKLQYRDEINRVLGWHARRIVNEASKTRGSYEALYGLIVDKSVLQHMLGLPFHRFGCYGCPELEPDFEAARKAWKENCGENPKKRKQESSAQPAEAEVNKTRRSTNKRARLENDKKKPAPPRSAGPPEWVR